MKQNAATDLGIRFKKVPYEILISTNNIKEAFLEGWYAGDGSKKEGNSRRFDIKGQIGAAGRGDLGEAIKVDGKGAGGFTERHILGRSGGDAVEFAHVASDL